MLHRVFNIAALRAFYHFTTTKSPRGRSVINIHLVCMLVCVLLFICEASFYCLVLYEWSSSIIFHLNLCEEAKFQFKHGSSTTKLFTLSSSMVLQTSFTLIFVKKLRVSVNYVRGEESRRGEREREESRGEGS